MPSHLRSSKARAPSVSAIGLRRPGVVDFERTGIGTTPIDMSAREGILEICETVDSLPSSSFQVF